MRLARSMTVVLVASVLIFGLAINAPNCFSGFGIRKAPALTVWAWDRYEDISFLDPQLVSVAYYAGTIYLKNDRALFKPRLCKLKLPPAVKAYPVFRIENLSPNKSLLQTSPDLVVKIIKQYQSNHSGRSIQIDYDATESERQFYISLLRRLRTALPEKTYISITALTSWCLDDRWLQRADADEAVVMLFSMGQSTDQILSLLASRKLDTGAKMDLSIGIRANEPSTNDCLKKQAVLKNARQLYIFNSLPWTPARFKAIIHEVLDQ